MTDVRRIASENRRVIWILAVGLIINAALYALVVYPLARRVYAREQQAGDAIRDLNAARRAFALAEATVSGKQQAEQELDNFYREILPPDFSEARRILRHAERLARSVDLTTFGSRFNPAQDRRSDLRKITTTLTLAGEYTSIRQFIYELETAPEFLVLESISVSQSPEGRDLNVTAQVATYYRAGADGN